MRWIVAKLLQLTMMAPPPLQITKLYVPAVRTTLVDRERLLARLNGLRSEGSRIGLISAPAGYGKTTLAVQWLARVGWPVAWISLDGRDNSPARFFAYLIAAVQGFLPEAGKAALALLYLPGVNLEEVVTLLANDLAEAPGPFVLVLDDFHAITSTAIHQAIEMLVDAQPPQMRLLLLTREDPAIQLSRRRVSGQLVEVRQDDLRFLLDEALAFLSQSMGLRLSIEQVELLEERTEGWIAGLQMAALAVQGQDVDRFLRNFSGSHRFILDYLVEEVLATQPEAVQQFLLETSVFDRICASLCAAVTGNSSAKAQQRLEQLARANLFVIPLDEERRWFRYHHLFRDLLAARLRAQLPGRVAELEISASDWYEQNGDPRLAVEYALKANDLNRAADLFERHISERWQTVELEFHLLIERLPFSVVASRPALCLQNAWLCVMMGKADRMLPFVEAAEKALAEPEHQNDAGTVNRAFARTLRTYLSDMANQPVEVNESLDLVMAAIPESNVGMRNSVAVVIGTLFYMEGKFNDAMRYFEDALARDQRVNGTNAVPIATMRMVFVLFTQGRLREAERLLQESEQYVRDRGSRRFYISGAIQLMQGAVLLERNELSRAEGKLLEGISLMDDWPIPPVRALGYSMLARLRSAQGDQVSAQAALAQADALKQAGHFHPMFSNVVEQARVRLMLAGKDRAGLEAWVHEHQAAANLPTQFRYEAQQIELCRALLALGRLDEAVALLDLLLNAASDRSGSRIAVLALLSAAGRLVVVEEALRLGEPESYLRTYVEAGEPFRQALSGWLRQGRSKDDPRLNAFAQRILAAFDDPVAVRSATGQTELLSIREQEVLRLVAAGLTNQQIADRLVISVRTVKKHVENIHGKLGAENRTQAAARARALGLLD